MNKHIFSTLRCGAAVAALAAFTSSHAVGVESADADLFSLSIAELISMEVTSASKRKQPLSETTSAVFVISQDDIRRSGAANIPEALRMAPGVQVAQIDGNKYAVTARGFNGRFANKLLVLIDGRTIYNPLFSGIYWDMQDMPMQDIERIEVIRGPGGTLWGSNAVNGVINIITKSTADSLGGSVVASTGSQTNYDVSARWGGELGADSSYRVFGTVRDTDSNLAVDGSATNDAWRMARAGGRIDWSVDDTSSLTFIAEVFDGETDTTTNALLPIPPFQFSVNDTYETTGGFGLARWNKSFSEGSESEALVYVDTASREGRTYREQNDAYNIELQHRVSKFNRQDIVFGASFRHNTIEFRDSLTFQTDFDSKNTSVFSVFAQDEIELVRDKLLLTIGTKIEKNNQSRANLDVLPNIRGIWNVNERNHIWAAVTKAIRTPSQFELEGTLNAPLTERLPDTLPTLPVPYGSRLRGNPEQDSEKLTAYELGYRAQPLSSVRVDISVFHNEYKNLRALDLQSLTCEPSGTPVDPTTFGCVFDPTLDPLTQLVLVGARFSNASRGESNGLEVAADWIPIENWRLIAAYTYLDLELTGADGITEPAIEDPKHQLSLQSRTTFRQRFDLDLWLRYVDNLEFFDIDDYWSFDARLAWRVQPNVEVAFVGKNLTNSSTLQFASESEDAPLTEIQRSASVEVRWNF